MADQLGICSDPAAVFLAEHLIQSDNGDKVTCNDFFQNRAGAYRRQLITVSDQNESGLIRNGPEQLLCKIHIQHRYLIHKNEICIQHFRITVLPVFVGHKTQCPVNCGGFDTGCLFHAPGCFSSGSAAGNLGSGIPFFVEIQKCLLN